MSKTSNKRLEKLKKRLNRQAHPVQFVAKPIVETVKPTEEKQMNEKLILDQPDTVTTEGTIERVVVPPQAKPMNEANPASQQVSNKEVLLTDDASEGVEILLG